MLMITSVVNYTILANHSRKMNFIQHNNQVIFGELSLQ